MTKFLSIIKALTIPACCILLSGFGYHGNLPELGKNSKPVEAPKQEEAPQNSDRPSFPEGKLFFPRMYSNYNIEKYSSYTSDINEIKRTLTTLKEVLEKDTQNKVQKFCAKVNVLHLYVENLKEKYANSAEKNYESFKQLVALDKTLMETANYKRETDKYRKNLRGSLASKLEDEAYMRQKVEKSLVYINNVLDILGNK